MATMEDFVQSPIVKGQVSMGDRPSLPVPGVAIILGNDLSGNKVWPDLLPSLLGLLRKATGRLNACECIVTAEGLTAAAR
ncbi:unnamed protein product [Pleuronectes platessa]|uniref:Uncharacterized protein n=1 Tax=Pleuronectes platessa TaxID=8262 RepID=A0A9N7UTJ3_PLEPL|nr:unnamed protein product [Pleuronectes platessa]